MAQPLRIICCPANYADIQIMPEIGHLVQFQWLPVDNISIEDEEDQVFGSAISMTQNGHFSGNMAAEDRPKVTHEMWGFKWRVTEIYSEFYFRKGGGNSRRAWIVQTKEPRNEEDKISDELIESMTVVDGMVHRGAVIKEEAIEDIPAPLIKQEILEQGEELVENGVVEYEEAHSVVIKAEEIAINNQEVAHDIMIKEQEIEDAEEQFNIAAEVARNAGEESVGYGDESEGYGDESEGDEEESGDDRAGNYKRTALARDGDDDENESDDQAGSDDQGESPKKRRRVIGASR